MFGLGCIGGSMRRWSETSVLDLPNHGAGTLVKGPLFGILEARSASITEVLSLSSSFATQAGWALPLLNVVVTGSSKLCRVCGVVCSSNHCDTLECWSWCWWRWWRPCCCLPPSYSETWLLLPGICRSLSLGGLLNSCFFNAISINFWLEEETGYNELCALCCTFRL